ncbi:MAG: recombinase family protein [Tepidisphaeraceae bacterium]|jgi:DNA invertase Pin-like site-specific DNA recombinase
MKKHIAVYIRVSTKAQDTKSQEPDLDRYAEAQPGRVVIYRDKYSGKTMDRPGWNKLKNAMDRGEVSSVVVWRLDRLGRTAKGLTALFDELRERKINLVSIKDGIDLNTTAGRLIANVLASVAQYETEVRGERVLAGQAVARATGKRWGGSKKGRLIWVKPEQVKMVRRMRKEGAGVTAIAKTTGLTRPTIYKLFSAD